MGTYRHQWDVGSVGPTVDAIKAMAIIIARPNDIFPFEVHGLPTIVLKQKYQLMNTIGPRNYGFGADPVLVTTLTPTKFTFTTLAGHHRGAGQTITFETIVIGGHVNLVQYGTFNSADPRQYAYNAGAAGAWAIQAHNLRVALGTLGMHPTGPALGSGGKTDLGLSEMALDLVVSATYLKVF